MREVFELIAAVATSDASVIITGESGTGKELVARAVHDGSRRKGGPFVAVNVAAIPEGLAESEFFGHEKGAFTGAVAARPGCFELADTGTLFLDEVTEMPAALQAKLLRVLEAGTLRRVGGSREVRFDVRVIAATNRDPVRAVEDGALRRDLFYRLNVFTLALPPLRERESDVLLLAQYFVRHFNAKHGAGVEGLGREAERAIRSYDWPGNVRELRNVLERGAVVAQGHVVQLADLGLPDKPEGATARPGPLASLEEVERRHVAAVLAHTGGNVSQSARILGIDRVTLYSKMKKWGLRRDGEGEPPKGEEV
jgi:DNA-binding NtrC family response regulator